MRRETAPAINLGGVGVTERIMTPRGQARLQLVHTTAQPQASGGKELHTINCEVEVLYILKGSTDIVLADRRQRLTVGDARTFPGGGPHTWENASETQVAEMLWILSPAPWSGSS
ncbi:hypothetical protein GCM10009721_26520 [Terrabacter tumescens]|uniref:Cupin type-2 domain-containing protein n=1 Tax=Terrabacter tumescens TaxID=60443 RepID=A0ABQ2I4P6_9MICO|nr:cupin domain-containing protein [Terrabacter tumescens]GGM98247.1 hypothetical protein GCM10009721_26520 [Terrabacter tumescens]